MKHRRGGKRQGAGRKPQDGAERVKPYCVMLDEETVRKAKLNGFGSLSVGIRKKFKEHE